MAAYGAAEGIERRVCPRPPDAPHRPAGLYGFSGKVYPGGKDQPGKAAVHVGADGGTLETA